MGEGAAKTGLSWMRGGKEDEDDDEEEEGVLRVAKTEGHNVAFLREVLAGEMEERHQPLMEEVDIGANGDSKLCCYIANGFGMVMAISYHPHFNVTKG